MSKPNPFKGFHSSPEVIRLAVMLYARFPLSLRNVEDLLHERGTDISHETVRFWWHRFGPMFATEIGAVASSLVSGHGTAQNTKKQLQKDIMRWSSS